MFSTQGGPPPIPGIARVTQLKILGVIVDEKLNFQLHINELIKSCAQALFALKTLHHHGLSEKSIQLTFTSKVLSKITYASPAWSGFISEGSRDQLEGILRKTCRFKYYSPSKPTFSQLVIELQSTVNFCQMVNCLFLCTLLCYVTYCGCQFEY